MTPMPNVDQHPCFNAENRHKTMRIHLPVAPRCNLQCNFCTRRFDCVNESRPGVTQEVLTPAQALDYLDEMLRAHPQIAVAGIAGPGDPFANPVESMETLRRVRERHPGLLLCVASNGLNIRPFVEELGALGLSHVSLTVNAVDPEIAGKIYPWVRHGKRVLTGREAAEVILENQLAAIPELKARGVLVKVNTVVIQGINDAHVPEVARTVKQLGADLINPMPMYFNAQAAFGAQHVPSLERMREIKKELQDVMPVMLHCTRCRADAVGFLGQSQSEADREALRRAAQRITPDLPAVPVTDERRYVAVATREGLLVNQHLGEASLLWVYGRNGRGVKLVEKRPAPPAGGGDERWRQLAGVLRDCSALMVSGIGARPQEVLAGTGLNVYRVEGLIEEIVAKALDGRSLCAHLAGPKRCGETCGGNNGGCG